MKNKLTHLIIEPLEARIAPATLYAVDTNNHLVSFNADTPGTLATDVAVTGLKLGEVVAGLDFRPVDGKLYALGLVDDGATRTGRPLHARSRDRRGHGRV